MTIQYGCDCDCRNHDGYDLVPVAYLIERNGKEMKVCTRCDLTGDKYIARLFDSETLVQPFIDYDALGALCLQIDDEDWKEFQTRRNSHVTKGNMKSQGN